LRALDDVIVTEGTELVYATPMPVGTEEATVEPDAAATEESPAIVGERPTLISEFTTNNINPTNPITAGLEGDLAFFVARSLEIDASIQGFQVTPLIFTDRNYYGETNFPAYLNNGTFNFNIGNDTTQGELPLAAAFSNDSTQTRVILIGDREFATN